MGRGQATGLRLHRVATAALAPAHADVGMRSWGDVVSLELQEERHPPQGIPLSWSLRGHGMNTTYRFSVIVEVTALTDDGILEATEAHGRAGCDDARSVDTGALR